MSAKELNAEKKKREDAVNEYEKSTAQVKDDSDNDGTSNTDDNTSTHNDHR